jgi:hypothetical protein
MEWFKTYSNTPHRPQVLVLSDRAFRLWHDARCYIADVESDGFIPAAQLPRFGTHGAKRYAMELVDGGLWEQATTGYIDLVWGAEGQRTAEQAVRDREAATARQRRKRHGVTDGVTNAVTNGVSHATRGREEKRREEVEVGVGFGLPALTVVGDDW